MLTQDEELLRSVSSDKRFWQGIPSIEVTKKGRIFLAFYSGGTREEIGNYVLLTHSDDGVHFTDPTAVAYPNEGERCFDSVLWIDPEGKLWWFWSVGPLRGVWAAVCDDPDADEIVFGPERRIGGDVMMNRPTLLQNGDIVYPLAVWSDRMLPKRYRMGEERTGAFCYRSSDGGKTVSPIGKAVAADRSYDEHIFVERADGSLSMFIRTKYGIAVSHSRDGGVTWSEPQDSGIPGPCSRFHICRLRSGRLLMVNHYRFEGRNNLTALLSEDDGESWRYSLLLDGRDSVAYPDAKETEDGRIFICYDRERGGFQKSFDDAAKYAREILFCSVTEEDVMAGKPVSPGSFLARVASKLTDYSLPIPDPYVDETKTYF